MHFAFLLTFAQLGRHSTVLEKASLFMMQHKRVRGYEAIASKVKRGGVFQDEADPNESNKCGCAQGSRPTEPGERLASRRLEPGSGQVERS